MFRTRTEIIRLFSGLATDEMFIVIGDLNAIMHKRLNYIVMEIETVEVTALLPELVTLSAGVRKLQDYIFYYRCWIRNARSKCHIPQSGTLYDRLRVASVLPRIDLTYRQPRRGDLSILCSKWKVSISEYQSGRAWIYLGGIVREIARATATWGCPKLVFTDLNNAFLTGGCWFQEILMTLGRVCKEWRVVLKHHCVWWGPAGQYFALF